jgi:drug/metabolite transporter (DMT)-like permease
MTQAWRGPAFMMGAMVAYTLNDAFMKTLAGNVPLFQAILMRGILSCVAIYLLARAYGGLQIPRLRKDRILLCVRTLAEVSGAFFFVSSLFNMPLANVSAILQALPLTVTLAGALFLKEPVGWRRAVAIGIGFFGVLLIVRPGPEGFNAYAIYVIMAVIAVTIRDLVVRRMTTEVSSTTAAFTAAIGVTCFAAVGSLGTTWVAISAAEIGALGAATISLVAAYIWSVAAMRHGNIASVAPFRYTSLLAALVLGFLFFGEFPDRVTLLGAAIVILTGLFTLWRENRVGPQSVK